MIIADSRYIRAALLVAALLIPDAARADEAAEKAALAQQVVSLAVAPGIDGRIARMISEVAARMPAERQEGFRTEVDKATAPIRADLLAEFARYYATSLSLGELKDVAAFYASPAGRKLVQVDETKPAEVSAAIQQHIIRLVTILNSLR